MKKRNVEEDVIKEILKNCTLYERIVVKVFNKQFIKIYKMGISFGFNNK